MSGLLTATLRCKRETCSHLDASSRYLATLGQSWMADSRNKHHRSQSICTLEQGMSCPIVLAYSLIGCPARSHLINVAAQISSAREVHRGMHRRMISSDPTRRAHESQSNVRKSKGERRTWSMSMWFRVGASHKHKQSTMLALAGVAFVPTPSQ
jgi:hypothetical protein